MAFVVIGTNYRYSPIEFREKISFSKKRLKDAFCFLKEAKVLRGCSILSTCNRVELYASVEDPEIGVSLIEGFLSMFYEIDKKKLRPYLYIYKDVDAARHLFRVASGLDSLILGESQILAQARDSFYESEKNGFVDGLLKEVFSHAFYTAKIIHIETKISEGKISIGSVAIDFIREKIGNIDGKNVLIIGVGKVTELVLKYLKKEVKNLVFISNRTFRKAERLADRIGAMAVRFDNLKEFLRKADIVITATRSPHFIIKKETIKEAFSLQPSAFSQKHLLIVDLALPRDVDPRVRELNRIELLGLEDLSTLIQKNRDKRKIEARKAEKIIDGEVEKLWERLSGLELEKVPWP